MKSILVMFVLTFALAGSAFAGCSEADQKALEAFDRAWGTATETGDRAALMAIYADDYSGIPGMGNKTQAVDGAVAAAERNKNNPAMAAKLLHDHYQITCTNSSAVVTHRNIATRPNGPAGRETTVWTRSIHFLEKRGGKWLVVGNVPTDVDDAATLEYMEMDWAVADVKNDSAWFERTLADDYIGISSTTAKVFSKSAELADRKDSKAVTEWAQASNLNTRVDGNRGFVTGIYHVKGRDEKGVAYDRRIRFIDTYIRRDGRWQAWTSQGTLIP